MIKKEALIPISANENRDDKDTISPQQKFNLKCDRLVDIASAKSSTSLNWKNRQVLWSDFLERLSRTHRTHESYSEYVSSKKDRQAEIKNVGGFVGGHLTNGSRKKGNVLHRQVITLDVDYATQDFWDDFTLTYGCAACVYSTHKHSPEHPRLRLIIPLSRPVFADEYMAIAHKVAGVLDIELFDPTTFQPERLMYWPSTSKDGEFIFEYQDGEWLDADKVINSYTNWKDSSEWPISIKADAVVITSMKKQGEPTEKTGIIGAFCREYNISEAIEKFLPEVYEPSDVEGRYSYKQGSTSGGLVLYEDKFAYSHHGSDPVSGKLCNAFDLVRIHKFGLKDENIEVATPGNKRPSYIAMLDLVTSDPKVKSRVVAEKIETARGDFKDDEILEESKEDNEWRSKLGMDRKGNIYNTIDNIFLIFENDTYFKRKIAYDDFEKCEVALSDLPWRAIDHQTRRLIDSDDSNIRHYLEKYYGISNAAKIRDAMVVLAKKTSFHPVQDYLSSLRWDGKSRVEKLLTEYQGAVDSEYTRMITRKILVAAVSRVFQPGVKFDHVLVLVGDQGLKKSALVAKLGRQWFSDSFSTVEGKESFEQLQGVWIVEIAELAGLAKAEVEKIKHFITKRDDRFRVAFGRRTEKFPRQCVFFATTNKRDFLRDPTGDRRYWPVLVNVTKPSKDVFKDFTDDEIDQVWAEAVRLYKKGETLYLPDSMVATATQIQKEHSQEHPWTGLIQNYLDVKLPEGWNNMGIYERRAFLTGEDEFSPKGTLNRTRVCLIEIYSEAIKGKDPIDERSATAIRNIMQNIEGWVEQSKPTKHNIYGTQRKGYLRVEVSNPELPVTNPLTKWLQPVTE